MPHYCVITNAQPTGEHEVHDIKKCSCLPDRANQKDLGRHPDCKSALIRAKQIYDNVDGCIYCVPECHSR